MCIALSLTNIHDKNTSADTIATTNAHSIQDHNLLHIVMGIPCRNEQSVASAVPRQIPDPGDAGCPPALPAVTFVALGHGIVPDLQLPGPT